MLHSTKKKYMFIIYELRNKGAAVRGIDVATSLGVKKASVSLMLPNLINEGLIERTEHGYIAFTEKGAVFAAELYLRYLTLYRFFTEKLRSSAESARADAICCLCSMTEENSEGMANFILNEISEAEQAEKQA